MVAVEGVAYSPVVVVMVLLVQVARTDWHRTVLVVDPEAFHRTLVAFLVALMVVVDKHEVLADAAVVVGNTCANCNWNNHFHNLVGFAVATGYYDSNSSDDCCCCYYCSTIAAIDLYYDFLALAVEDVRISVHQRDSSHELVY